MRTLAAFGRCGKGGEVPWKVPKRSLDGIVDARQFTSNRVSPLPYYVFVKLGEGLGVEGTEEEGNPKG